MRGTTMTANNFSLEISKYPQFRTPISDVGLEPKERAIFQSSLPAISELVDHQHLVAVAGDATKIKREERAFYVGLQARLNRGERATRTLLDEAIRLGSMRSVKLLAQKGIRRGVGARIDDPIDWKGNTRLHLACCNGESDKVSFLIRCGANPFVENRDDETPFQLVFNDTELQELPERQYAILRGFAGNTGCHTTILDRARRLERWDIIVLMIAEGHLKASDVFWYGRLEIHEELLLNLKDVFKAALKSNDEAIVKNCVEILCHILFRGTPELAGQARRVLRDWSNSAGDIVRKAYDDRCTSGVLSDLLSPFEEQIKL
jgi:Ankyrin repeat